MQFFPRLNSAISHTSSFVCVINSVKIIIYIDLIGTETTEKKYLVLKSMSICKKKDDTFSSGMKFCKLEKINSWYSEVSWSLIFIFSFGDDYSQNFYIKSWGLDPKLTEISRYLSIYLSLFGSDLWIETAVHF